MKYFKITVFLSIILFLVNCNPKEEIAPENPCKDVTIPIEGFKVIENLNLSRLHNTPDLEIETDTVYGTGVIFRAIKQYDTYSWIFENDTFIRHGKEISLDFGNPNGYGAIKVTMIGNRKPNPLCIPHDDGVDTFTKTIYNVSITQLGFFGTYLGYDSDRPDSLYKLIIKRNPNPLDTNWVFYLDSIKSDCTIIPGDPNTPEYYSVGMGTSANSFIGGCPCNIDLYGYRDKKSRLLYINRFYFAALGEPHRTKKTFIGQKIQ